MAPAEKPKPSLRPSALTSAIDVPVSTACSRYSGQATNMNANSSGSVTPVTNDVSAPDSSTPPTTLRRPGAASWNIARAAAGSANIMIGKNPVMYEPAVGSPDRNRATSPCTVDPPGGVYEPTANQGTELSRWCRPNGTRSRFATPYRPAPSTSLPTSQRPNAVRPLSKAG